MLLWNPRHGCGSCDWIPEAGVQADLAAHGQRPACSFLAARATGGSRSVPSLVLMRPGSWPPYGRSPSRGRHLIQIQLYAAPLELTAVVKPHSSDTSSKVRSPLLRERWFLITRGGYQAQHVQIAHTSCRSHKESVSWYRGNGVVVVPWSRLKLRLVTSRSFQPSLSQGRPEGAQPGIGRSKCRH